MDSSEVRKYSTAKRWYHFKILNSKCRTANYNILLTSCQTVFENIMQCPVIKNENYRIKFFRIK